MLTARSTKVKGENTFFNIVEKILQLFLLQNTNMKRTCLQLLKVDCQSASQQYIKIHNDNNSNTIILL